MDHTASLGRLRKVRGQVAGIEKMITEGRYYVDILTQLSAALSALETVKNTILMTHVRGCVAQAMESKNPREINAKIRELETLLGRRI